MKIDLHAHTKKCKTGDGTAREVTRDKFIQKVNSAGVDIVAITNHNLFDIDQYNEFQNGDFKVWPGVELDVSGNDSKNRGHCIIVVNPEEVSRFDAEVKKLCNADPDNVLISIDQFVDLANQFDSLVMCHYRSKTPHLSDEDLVELKDKINPNIPVFMEPSNLIKAGIYLGKNIDSLLGSDVKNWDEYELSSFPELKIDVDSFEHLKKLILKDAQIIRTFVDQKRPKTFTIIPFEDKNVSLTLTMYNDVNVLIGGKGTGKTKILEALEKEYSNSGDYTVSSYYANDKKEKYKELIAKKLSETDFECLGIEKYSQEFEKLSNWLLPALTKTSDYYQWNMNKNKVKNFGFANITFLEVMDDSEYKNEFAQFKRNKELFNEVLNEDLTKYLDDNKIISLKDIINELLRKQANIVKDKYCDYYSLYLKKYTIDKMKTLYQLKSGKASKPSECGLLKLYNCCYNLKKTSSLLLEKIQNTSKEQYMTIGNLDENRVVRVKQLITLNPYGITDIKYINNEKKMTALRNVISSLYAVKANAFKSNNTEKVGSLKQELESNHIKSLIDFMGHKLEVVISNTNDLNKTSPYNPSNGEQAMLILNHALCEDCDVYILDEPEMSVGHDYINSVILPKIRDLAKLNKTIIAATHDANIAVRSLPFTTIYRKNGTKPNDCMTYIGQPFIEEMEEINNTNDKISWSKTCMEVLEGGDIAFRERGETYGKRII